MTDTIPVVDVVQAESDAYDMGFERFEDAEVPGDEFDMSGFTDSAEYANHVLPDLRARAGYGDATGKGTYTKNRDVAMVAPADADDKPVEASVVPAALIFESLVEKFHEGAYDAATDENDADAAEASA